MKLCSPITLLGEVSDSLGRFLNFYFPSGTTPLEYGIGFGTLETHALLVPYRIDGIVVAQENEEVLLEAWRQEEQLLIEKQMKVWLHIAGPIPHEENIH